MEGLSASEMKHQSKAVASVKDHYRLLPADLKGRLGRPGCMSTVERARRVQKGEEYLILSATREALVDTMEKSCIVVY